MTAREARTRGRLEEREARWGGRREGEGGCQGGGDGQAAGLNRGRPTGEPAGPGPDPRGAATRRPPSPTAKSDPHPIRVKSESIQSRFRVRSGSVFPAPGNAAPRAHTASPPRCKRPAFPRTSASLARGASSPRPAARMRRGSGTLHTASPQDGLSQPPQPRECGLLRASRPATRRRGRDATADVRQTPPHCPRPARGAGGVVERDYFPSRRPVLEWMRGERRGHRTAAPHAGCAGKRAVPSGPAGCTRAAGPPRLRGSRRAAPRGEHHLRR
jgi:hypothetical protein